MEDDDADFLRSLDNEGENVEKKTQEEVQTAPTAPQEKKRGGIFDRIFNKPQSILSIDLSELLMREGNSQIFCVAVAKSLVLAAPVDIYPELRDSSVQNAGAASDLPAKGELLSNNKNILYAW